MNYIEAPEWDFDLDDNKISVFLAGGITDCSDWQKTVTNQLQDLDITIYNPRRKNFPIDNPNAAFEQIKWEYSMLRKANIILFWFCPETMCPIVLYELGAHSMTDKTIVIGVDKNYERKQDVEIQTHLVRPDIKIFYSLDDTVNRLKQHLNDKPDFTNYLHSIDDNRYYLRIPINVIPPKIDSTITINNEKYFVKSLSTPEDIMRGRGGPVARSMMQNGIGWDANLEKINGYKHLSCIQREFTKYAMSM